MDGRRNEPRLAAPCLCNHLRTIQNAKAPLQMLVGNPSRAPLPTKATAVLLGLASFALTKPFGATKCFESSIEWA